MGTTIIVEKYKDVIGYEGLYYVSSYGYLYSYDRTWISGNGGVRFLKGRQIKGHISNGYYCAKVCKNGIDKVVKIHRLVAISFIKNPHNKPQVNHKNGVKTDNRIDNLEWATAGENIKHAIDNNLLSIKNAVIAAGKKRMKRVINLKTNKIYDSMNDAYPDSGYSQPYFSEMLRGLCNNKTDFILYDSTDKK